MITICLVKAITIHSYKSFFSSCDEHFFFLAAVHTTRHVGSSRITPHSVQDPAGSKPVSPVVEVQSPNHWAAKDEDF